MAYVIITTCFIRVENFSSRFDFMFGTVYMRERERERERERVIGKLIKGRLLCMVIINS